MPRPFNIDEVKQNDILPTRDGKDTIKILCTNASGNFPIIGLDKGNGIHTFQANGKWQWNDDDDSMDLVLPDYTESVDVYVYRDKIDNELFTSHTVIDTTLFTNIELIKKVTIEI